MSSYTQQLLLLPLPLGHVGESRHVQLMRGGDRIRRAIAVRAQNQNPPPHRADCRSDNCAHL